MQYLLSIIILSIKSSEFIYKNWFQPSVNLFSIYRIKFEFEFSCYICILNTGLAPKTSPVEESKENSNKSQTFDKMQTPKESNMELVDQDQDQESNKNQIDNQFEEQKNQSFNDENNQIKIVKITVKDWSKQ